MRKNSQALSKCGIRWAPVVVVFGAFLVACTSATPPAAPEQVAAGNPRSSRSSGMTYGEAPPASVTAAAPQVSLVRDHRLGDPQAGIGIVEFSDYQCPYCRGFHQELFPQLKQKYIDSGLVQFIHKDLPLTTIHAQAMPAALAAVCAGEQGRFWVMYNALFENTLDPALYPGLAQQLGLDAAKFAACLKNPASGRVILRDLSEARRLGISGTPSFLIGRIEGNVLTVVAMAKGAPSWEAFSREIDALRHPKAGVTPQTK